MFIETDKYSSEYIYCYLKDSEYDKIIVQANDIEGVQQSILNYINQNKVENIAFNLTGGTKLMFVGAYNACNKLNAVPYYIDATKRMIFRLDNDTKRPLDAHLKIEDFIKLNAINSSYNIVKKETLLSDIEKKCLSLMWNNRYDIKKIFSTYIQNKELVLNKPFFSNNTKITLLDSKTCSIKIDDVICIFRREEGAVKFLSGTWFEEYIYSLIDKYIKEGSIIDVALGTKVEYEKVSSYEFDILFTDGKILFEIECKSGKVEQTDITKLNSNAKYFGGSEVCSILATFKDITDNGMKEKINGLKIAQIYGINLSNQLEDIITERLSRY